MKKLLKIFSILLALSLAIPMLIACGDTPPSNPPSNPPVVTPGTTPGTSPETTPEQEDVCGEDCVFNATAWFDYAKHYPKTLVCTKDQTHVVERTKIEISTADELMLIAADLDSGAYIGATEIVIAKNVDMIGKTWTPINLRITSSSRYAGETLEIDGRNNVIKNLTMNTTFDGNAGIFGEVSGEISIVIKNLTLDNAKIYGDVNDVNTNASQRGVGAFIGLPRGIKGNISISNCTVVDSLIKGGHWAGGFIGYARKEITGMASSKILIEILDCILTTSVVESVGSAGGFMGHAGGCENVMVEVFGGEISNCTINSTGDSIIKAGAFIGTIGRAQVYATNLTISENLVISHEQENTERVSYGRFGDAEDIKTGTLSVNGKVVPPHEN